MSSYKSLFLIFVLGLGFQVLLAQDRVSEEVVNIQKVFIEASREKILGNYENAAFLYKEVLKRDAKNDAAAYELARIYDYLNKDDKAIKSIKAAIDLDDTNTWYKDFLADLYKKTGKDLDAARIYENLVKNHSDESDYYYRWAYFLVRANNINKAIKVYDGLESKIGISEELIRRKHSLYMGLGNNKKAAEELQRLIQAYPQDVEYRHLLAGFYEQISEKELALGVYRKIVELEPDDVRANIALAETLKKEGTGDMSYLNSLKAVFEKPEVHIDIKIAEIFPYVNKVADEGDLNLATAMLELTDILKGAHPDEAKVYAVAGDLLYHSGKKKEALTEYEKTIALNDNIFMVWEQVLYIHFEEREFDKLKKVSEDVMDLFPNQTIAYYFNGMANYENKDYRAALSVLEQADLMSGKNPRLKFDINFLLGKVYFELGQYDKSDRAFDNALKLNPKAPNLLNEYSYHLARRGEMLDKAKEMSALANELQPRQSRYQDTYGWILYKMKEYEGAQEWLQKAMDNGGDLLPEILEHYGDVLYQMNEIENAMEFWQKAQQNGGNSELLEKKIADKKLYE